MPRHATHPLDDRPTVLLPLVGQAVPERDGVNGERHRMTHDINPYRSAFGERERRRRERPPGHPGRTDPQGIWPRSRRRQLPKGINCSGENRRRRTVKAVRTNKSTDELAIGLVSGGIPVEHGSEVLHVLREGGGRADDSAIARAVPEVQRAFLAVGEFR